MFKLKKGITADEFMRELERDPEFARRKAEREKELKEREAESRRDQAPVLKDLATVGVRVESV